MRAGEGDIIVDQGPIGCHQMPTDDFGQAFGQSAKFVAHALVELIEAHVLGNLGIAGTIIRGPRRATSIRPGAIATGTISRRPTTAAGPIGAGLAGPRRITTRFVGAWLVRTRLTPTRLVAARLVRTRLTPTRLVAAWLVAAWLS